MAFRDLPYSRQDLQLEAWPEFLGRWSPTNGPGRATLITIDGTSGGLAGPCRKGAHHLDAARGLFNDLARRLPAQDGVAVLQLVPRRPGPHRLAACVLEASLAVERVGGPAVLLGHSMGGAVACAAATNRAAEVAGLCLLASQTTGVPMGLRAQALRSTPLLLIHGTADDNVAPKAADIIHGRLTAPVLPTAPQGKNHTDRLTNSGLEDAELSSGSLHRAPRRVVMLDGAGHSFDEHCEEVTALVEEWLRDLLR